MKTIYKDEYKNDGTFINLQYDYYYEELILNHSKYLNKDQKYYVWCRGGIKSAKVVTELLKYGYDAVRVITR